jgi:energy-coupling factor transport system ATP-binding protein
MSIKIENLWYIYNEGTPMAITALEDIHLEIDDGECIGLIGRTGSGKSTLIQHFNGLLQATRGKVLVDGQDLRDKKTDRRKIRQKIGLVFQYPEYQLFEETIEADIGFAPKRMGLSKDEVTERVIESMQMVGLDYETFRKRSPFELSGGQMRRVAIAGVLAMNPNMLVLDEPSAGLDPEGRADILNQIRHMREKTGITVVYVSHSMDEIAQLVDRVIVMDKGKIVLQGSVRDIFMQAAKLKELGLGIPQITALMHRLRERGYDVSTGIVTIDEAKEAILSLKRGQDHV